MWSLFVISKSDPLRRLPIMLSYSYIFYSFFSIFQRAILSFSAFIRVAVVSFATNENSRGGEGPWFIAHLFFVDQETLPVYDDNDSSFLEDVRKQRWRIADRTRNNITYLLVGLNEHLQFEVFFVFSLLEKKGKRSKGL